MGEKDSKPPAGHPETVNRAIEEIEGASQCRSVSPLRPGTNHVAGACDGGNLRPCRCLIVPDVC
jgi:hypothetical protein